VATRCRIERGGDLGDLGGSGIVVVSVKLHLAGAARNAAVKIRW